MITCTKTTCVMDLEDPDSGKGFYVMREDDNGNVVRIVKLLDDTWDDLGRPAQITVTIEPGDRMNDGEIQTSEYISADGG